LHVFALVVARTLTVIRCVDVTRSLKDKSLRDRCFAVHSVQNKAMLGFTVRKPYIGAQRLRWIMAAHE